MSKRTPSRPALTEQLRALIDAWPETRYRIAQNTGIPEPTLSRFMSGQRGLSMPVLDTLGKYLDLEIRPRRRKRTK